MENLISSGRCIRLGCMISGSARSWQKERSRYEEQNAFALKQAQTGRPVAGMRRGMGISEQTFRPSKKLCGDLGTGDLRRLKQLVVDLSLDNHILQNVLVKTSDACSATRMRAPDSGGTQDGRAAQLRRARPWDRMCLVLAIWLGVPVLPTDRPGRR